MFPIDITEAGIGAIVALMILREVFSFLTSKKDIRPDILIMQRKIDELYDWHDQTDADGVKVWYIRKSLEESVDGLQETIKEFIRVQQLSLDVLKEISYQLRHIDTQVNQIDRKVHDL